MDNQKREITDDLLMAQVSSKLKVIDYDFSRFTILGFTQWVSEHTGQEIYLESVDDLTRPLGFWFKSDDGAYIRYSSQLQGVHKIITILHELIHIFMGHNTIFVSNLQIALTKYHAGFAARDPLEKNVEDQEAEMGAIILFQRIGNLEEAEEPQRGSKLTDLFNKVTDI